jgi:CHRD domain
MRYGVLTPIAAVLAAAVSAVAATAAMSPVVSAKMTGGGESPKGPAGASGLAVIHLNAAKGTVCWQFKNVKGVTGPNASHIHKGGKGVSGPVFIPLGAKFALKGCTTASKSSITAVESKPGAYYVNIHNAKYPNGAIRGQLVTSAAG